MSDTVVLPAHRHRRVLFPPPARGRANPYPSPLWIRHRAASGVRGAVAGLAGGEAQEGPELGQGVEISFSFYC
ncbi:hypothetical protein GCM10010483_09790 [Actinokineospora diospyrosa]